MGKQIAYWSQQQCSIPYNMVLHLWGTVYSIYGVRDSLPPAGQIRENLLHYSVIKRLPTISPICLCLFHVNLQSCKVHSTSRFYRLLNKFCCRWLIEINLSPSLKATNYADYKLKFGLLDDVLNIVDMENRQVCMQIVH